MPEVKALHDGTDETGGPDHPGSGWAQDLRNLDLSLQSFHSTEGLFVSEVKKLADEMAEQNHLMMFAPHLRESKEKWK